MIVRRAGGRCPLGAPLRLDDVGAHTGWEGTHKGCRYGVGCRHAHGVECTHKVVPPVGLWARTRRGRGGVPLRDFFINVACVRGEGTHKGCPYGWIWRRRHGRATGEQKPPTVMQIVTRCDCGSMKGCPDGMDEGCPRGGRAPTRGAPTGWMMGCPRRGEGTHKGCPYGLDEGCPRGGRAPTRGAPTGWMRGAREGGRAPTRGAPTFGVWGNPARTGYGAHKGCPVGMDEGCPRRGEGTLKGCLLSGWMRGAREGGGHPQGVPLRDG